MNSLIENIIYILLNRSFGKYIRKITLTRYIVFGDKSRLKLSMKAKVQNALLNVMSGDIIIEDYVFFGHNVSILTGSHDYNKFEKERMSEIPEEKRDIIIKKGAWIASNATIIGPCTIGEHSVVAACSLVTKDVPPYAMVSGVPAQVIKFINKKR